MATIHEIKPKEIKVTRTVHLKITKGSDGEGWSALLIEKIDPPTYPSGGPQTGHSLRFFGNTADSAKQKALDFIRGAAEALKGGEA